MTTASKTEVAPKTSLGQNKVVDPITELNVKEAENTCIPAQCWQVTMAAVFGFFAFANPDG